jgi:hypothetical protein
MITNLESPTTGYKNTSMFDLVSTTDSYSTMDDTNIMYAYMIFGVSLIIIAIVSLSIFYGLGGIYIVHVDTDVAEYESLSEGKSRGKIVLIVLFVIFYLFQGIPDRTYYNFTVTFCVVHLGWTKSSGSYLLSMMAMSGMICQVMMVYIVRVIPLEFIFGFGLLVCNVSLILLCVFVNYHWAVMWCLTITVYVSCTIYDSVMLALQSKYIGIQGWLGPLNFVCGSVTNAMVSPLVSYMFEYNSSMFLLYIAAACGIGCNIMAVLAYCLNNHQQYSGTPHEKLHK